MATSSGFSSALRLTDLDDFIGPSQECVKPVQVNKTTSTSGTGSVKIHNDGSYVQLNESGEEIKLEKAQITLNDCLACSGCVTSAETVLISQQSHTEFFKVLEDRNDRVKKGEDPGLIVVSVSPQSRASLAVKFGISPEEMATRLIAFFKHLGVDAVFDTTFTRDFALMESANEFIERFKNSSVNGNLPMLASACPGWVCYAEKTHGSFILPHISSTKSPQQIMGSLVKYHYAKLKNTSPGDVYHVTVMPCYDKKLEASRGDFYNDLYRTRDVDCVITSDEVLKMLEEKGVDILELPMATHSFADQMFTSSTSDGRHLLNHSGGGSGGFLEYILKSAAKELFGVSVDTIEYKVLRNRDFKECTLEVDGKVVLRFAAAYGFRNIQNLVQKMKRGKCVYQFVEVMACPSGCLNGGGQIKPDVSNSIADSKELLARVDVVYNLLQTRLPEENEAVARLYLEWLGSRSSDKAKELLHTQYHAVEKLVSALTIKW